MVSRYSYNKDEMLLIRENDYVKALIEKDETNPAFDIFRITSSKARGRLVLNFSQNSSTPSKTQAGNDLGSIVLRPQKRTWNTGCSVEGKDQPNNRGSQHNQETPRNNNTRFISDSGRPNNNQSSRGVNGSSSKYNPGDLKRSKMGSQLRVKASEESGYQSRNNFSRKDRSKFRTEEEEEPEWFSQGPTTVNDTIELGCLIDEDLESSTDEAEKAKKEPVKKSQHASSPEANNDISQKPCDIFQNFQQQFAKAEQSKAPSDSGGSRLKHLLGTAKPSPPEEHPAAPIKSDDMKSMEDKLRSIVLRSDTKTASPATDLSSLASLLPQKPAFSVQAGTSGPSRPLTVEELEAQELGGPMQSVEGRQAPPLENILTTIKNQTASQRLGGVEPSVGASKILSLMDSVRQQNERGATQREASKASLPFPMSVKRAQAVKAAAPQPQLNELMRDVMQMGHPNLRGPADPPRPYPTPPPGFAAPARPMHREESQFDAELEQREMRKLLSFMHEHQFAQQQQPHRTPMGGMSGRAIVKQQRPLGPTQPPQQSMSFVNKAVHASHDQRFNISSMQQLGGGGGGSGLGPSIMPCRPMYPASFNPLSNFDTSRNQNYPLHGGPIGHPITSDRPGMFNSEGH